MSYRVLPVLALVVTTLLAGERVPLPQKVFGSARVVEFTLTYAGTKKPVAVGNTLFPPGDTAPIPALTISLTAGSPCLKPARKKKVMKLLAFFDEKGRQVVGVEQDRGEGTELDPSYPALVEAVLEAKTWHDERMRAVGADQLWSPEKKALSSGNPYLQRLAASFLASHGASDVVELAWGAEWKKKEAAPPPFVCK